jgi:hypothetical protein
MTNNFNITTDDIVSDNYSQYIKLLINDDEFTNFTYSSLVDDEFNEHFKVMSASPPANNLNVFHVNIRSLNHNVDDLKQLHCSLNVKFHILILTEIWNTNLDCYSNAFTDYEFIFVPVENSIVGGVAMYIHKSVNFRHLQHIKFTTDANNKVESIWIEVTFQNEVINIGGIYRHPSTCTKSFLTQFENIINDFSNSHSLAIFGDFNIDLLKYNSSTIVRDYINMIIDNGLKPLVLAPTRVTAASSTLIDHIFIKLSSSCNFDLGSVYAGNIMTDFTDHYANFLLLPFFANQSNGNEVVHRRIFSTTNINKFKTDLMNVSWDVVFQSTNVNVSFNYFYSNIMHIYEKSFPLCPVSKKASKDQLWITPAIKKSSVMKNKLYKLWLRTKSPDDYEKYRKYRNSFTNVVRTAKISYYSDKFNIQTNSTRKIWQELNKLCKSSKTNANKKQCKQLRVNGSLLTDDKDIANAFNNHFVHVGVNLASNVPPTNIDFKAYLSNPCINTFHCEEVTEQEVLSELCLLKSLKKSSLEGLNPSVLWSAADTIVPLLTCIYNMSIIHGVFPDKLKLARVIPIFKSGSHDDPLNYRPISLLSIFDKILEKIMCRRLVSFLNKYNLLYSYQFGFRSHHSTTLALTELCDFIYRSLDDGYYILGLYLDVSKAFDTVSHAVLLQKLHHYGFRGNILNWFTSYLSNRHQLVDHNNVKSTTSNITLGVPQGSVLGPLLFLLYVNDLPNSTKLGCMRLFADDANHFIKDKNYLNLKRLAEDELTNIINWMHANLLTINLKKTNFTIFSPSAKPLHHNIINSISFHNQQISRVVCIKYLGVFIDESLSWKEHINFICSKIRQHCGILYKIRDYLPVSVRKQLYFALVHSVLQYGVEIYGNTKLSYLHDLYILNNRILRILQIANYRTRICDLFKCYNTLPVSKLFEYRVCLLVFKFLHYRHLLPPSFNNYFMQNLTIYSHNTRNCANIFVQRFNSRHGMRVLHYRAAICWNCLPPDLKSFSSVAVFKRRLLSFFTDKL